MTRGRTSLRAGLMLVMAALLVPLMSSAPMSSARAGDSPICCSDVKFPQYYGYGRGVVGPYLVVDGIGRGEGVYRTIQGALNDVRRDGFILIKPSPEGYYAESLRIEKPVTIQSFGGAGIVRIRPPGDLPCASVNLRREGKVRINGLAFETSSNNGACIVVERATEFALNASDVTAIRPPGPPPSSFDACRPYQGRILPAGTPHCGLVGVLIGSGVATIQGSQIRRTGTAIALVSAVGDTHKVQGNYIAGNGVGVFVGNGARFLIERNGIFRNYNYGLDLEDGTGLVADNDIEDNRTGLKVVPPAWFRSASAGYSGNGAAVDYSDVGSPVIKVERNLITQFGRYSLGRKDPLDKLATKAADGRNEGDTGYALEFGLDDYEDLNGDYPKRGSPLSSVVIRQNCFFGPQTTDIFDRDQWMPLIAKSNVVHDSVGHNDALTPLFDKNTKIEEIDYDAVDKIDHDNNIRTTLYNGFNSNTWSAIHNWFARNKKEMVCTFRFGEPVASDKGNWPGPTAPER